jgi:hypothetical protein
VLKGGFATVDKFKSRTSALPYILEWSKKHKIDISHLTDAK